MNTRLVAVGERHSSHSSQRDRDPQNLTSAFSPRRFLTSELYPLGLLPASDIAITVIPGRRLGDNANNKDRCKLLSALGVPLSSLLFIV